MVYFILSLHLFNHQIKCFSTVAEDDIDGAAVFDALASCDNAEMMCEWKADAAERRQLLPRDR